MIKQGLMWLIGLFLLMLGLAIGTQLDGLFNIGSDGSATASRMASQNRNNDAPVYRCGPFKVSVTVQPEAPQVGDNKLMVKVMDAQGKLVEDAQIQAFGQMPAMGAVPGMRAPAKLQQVAPGEYVGPMKLEMSGEWPLTVNIDKPGVGAATLIFDMATGRSGLQLTSGGTKVASGHAGANEPTYHAGPFNLNVAVEPSKPQVGKNRLVISLNDEEGKPISGAKVRAIATMPAMGAMPAMQAPATFEEAVPGRYVGTFKLPMGGAWPLSVQIKKEGIGSQKISFDMATGRPGLQLVSGAVAEGQTGRQVEPAPLGAIVVDSHRRQLIGVTIGKASYRHLTRDIRAVGQVVYDESKLSDVTLRFDAWIGDLYANYVGKHVKQGDVLFTVYGPELLATQQQYLEALGSRSDLSDGLINAARKRLLLWGMTPSQIDELERRGEPLDYVPILALRSGTVVAKNVVIGSANMAGTRLMRIADLSQVWIEVEVYEGELPLVQEGMPAVVTLPYLPGKTFKAKIDYVYPTLQSMTRTGRIRLTLDNPDGVLKPDMYAEVKLKADLGRRLVVPEGAVVFAGDDRVVFQDLGGGRLAPRRIETGQRNEDYIEVLKGLQPGDKVVTSGNFLIASETSLKAGMQQW